MQDVLARAESLALFCVKKASSISGSGSCRATLANATTCLDLEVLAVIEAFSIVHFNFKISSLPTAVPLLPTVNAFDVMRRTQTSFLAAPPRLDHARMYSNHHAYNELIAFLEKHELGWTTDRALTDGKRFVDGMSKAFFQCTLSTWKALNDKHNSGEFSALFYASDVYKCEYNPYMQSLHGEWLKHCSSFGASECKGKACKNGFG